MSEQMPSDEESAERADGGVLTGPYRDDRVAARSETADGDALETDARASPEQAGEPEQASAHAEREGEPRVCWLDDDDADEVISALSSQTARSIVTALQKQAHTASELADRVDTSVQNVRHHVENLQSAGLVEVGGTRYSVKGREMTVYTAADERVLVAVGSESNEESFLDSLRGLFGGLAALVAGSVLVQWLFARPTAVTRVPDGVTATGSPAIAPGAVFFAGGLVCLLAVLVATRMR